jgi:hypothetical protein
MSDMRATMMSRFSTAELLILGGAALLWAVQIIFGWVLAVTTVSSVWLAFAFILAAAIVFQRWMNMDLGARYTAFLVIVGLAVGVLTINDLVITLRGIGLTSDAVRLIDWVLQWVGGLAIGAGGFLAWRTMPRRVA